MNTLLKVNMGYCVYMQKTLKEFNTLRELHSNHLLARLSINNTDIQNC